MTAPSGGFDARPEVIETAATPLATADTVLDTFSTEVGTATDGAADGAGPGPLAGVLSSFGANAKGRADERGDECRVLSTGLRDAAEEYRTRDEQAHAVISGVPMPR